MNKLRDVERVIAEFSRPFIATAIHELLRRGAPIVYDFDLTGQAVSSTSTTYEGVGFGWMDDSVKLGYQLARVCLSAQDDRRLWLAGFHHPGDTVSKTCLKELVRAAEAHTNVRPRRRTDWSNNGSRLRSKSSRAGNAWRISSAPNWIACTRPPKP